MKIRVWLLVCVASSCWAASLGWAAEKTAADLLPSSTVGYVEIPQPKQLIGVVLDHPLRKKVEGLDQYKQALRTPQAMQFFAGVALIEGQLGMELRPAVEKLTGGGIYIGADPQTNGVATIIKADDPVLLEKVRDLILKFVRDDAKNKGQEDPVKSAEYRGLKAYRVGEARFVTSGPWLLMTNKDELGKKIADNFLDGGTDTLANDKYFQAARAATTGKPAAWAYVSLPPIRDAGLADALYKDKSDNPVAEILLGGVLSTLKKTPYATAALYLETEQVRLVASTPHDPTWTSKPREFFFGAGGKGAAPQPLTPKQSVLTLATFRDLSALWQAKADLFDENVNAGLSQADSTLTTLFSGRDFGRDILGAFRPEIQLVVARQDFKGLKTPEPDIKLPAAAVVFELKDTEKMQPQLKVLFQSLVGFLNVASAQQGQPPLDINTDSRGAGKLVTTTYLPDKTTDGKINYNFSPSIGFIGDRFIVSSTSGLATELLDLAGTAKPAASPAGAGRDNTRVGLSVPVLGEILQDNRKHLVAQNQLEKGHSKESAEKEIDALFTVLSAVRDLSFKLGSDEKNLNLELGLRLQPVK